MEPKRLYHPNGQLLEERWHLDGKIHRLEGLTTSGGPAVQRWNEDGQLMHEGWWSEDKKHRLNGPAWKYWDPSRTIMAEVWYVDDKKHRVAGPALQEWWVSRSLGSHIYQEQWWISNRIVEPISDPLEWAMWIAKTFGNVHGLEKYCLDNLDEKTARAILASSKLL